MGDLRAIVRRSRPYDLWQRLREDRQLITWARHPEVGPPPTLFKQRLVREHARRFALTTLVETGTFLGEMVRGVISEFRTIYSIELDPGLSARATSRFRGHKNVFILRGDSAEVLESLVRRLDSPVLYWLDAHFSGEGTAMGPEETPILRELRHILQHGHPDSAILIDDARCFGFGGWPGLEDLRCAVRSSRPQADFTVAEDIIRITPETPARAAAAGGQAPRA